MGAVGGVYLYLLNWIYVGTLTFMQPAGTPRYSPGTQVPRGATLQCNREHSTRGAVGGVYLYPFTCSWQGSPARYGVAPVHSHIIISSCLVEVEEEKEEDKDNKDNTDKEEAQPPNMVSPLSTPTTSSSPPAWMADQPFSNNSHQK